MNIKSLLLGSAAVLVAASTAQAADAIVVEPEPVEYVRICDAYGSGFFYIPGTETCMRIGGYVRSTYRHYTDTVGGVESNDHAVWNYRGRLNILVNNETDWGTLASYLRIQGGDASADGDANAGIDQAWISISGFRLGYGESLWGSNGATGPSIDDGFFNFDQAIFLEYTYAMDGLALVVGAQDSTGTAATSESPDYYAGLRYDADWGFVAAKWIHDSTTAANPSGETDGDAYSLAAEFNLGDSGWTLGAWYEADGEDITQYIGGGSAGSVVDASLADYQWGVQLNGALADNLSGYVSYSAMEAVSSSTTFIDATKVAVGLVWTPITGLKIQTEYVSYEGDYVLASEDADYDAFIVRVTRSW
ncbi:MAG: hypothetical protein COB78_08820 [Hyphomicrobiales bacterium]|nr:MAG: hypothetical protein COB78_08820 [Hyphomicrobiales bacterium]